MLKENEGKLSDSKTLVDKDSKPSTLCKCFSLKFLIFSFISIFFLIYNEINK